MSNRRNFIRWGIFGVILSRIFSRQSSVFAQTNSRSRFHQVGTISELKSQGFLLNEDLEIGAVLVTETKDKSLIAIDPTCTHAGCTVEWKEQKKSFICPCHQSKFKQDGTLIGGLASSNLGKYKVKVEKNMVFVAP